MHDVSLFPSESERLNFCKNYLIEFCNTEHINEEEVYKLATEGHAFSLASHFQWTLWGICQSFKSKIKWGFLEYAVMRWQQYLELKSILKF